MSRRKLVDKLVESLPIGLPTYFQQTSFVVVPLLSGFIIGGIGMVAALLIPVVLAWELMRRVFYRRALLYAFPGLTERKRTPPDFRSGKQMHPYVLQSSVCVLMLALFQIRYDNEQSAELWLGRGAVAFAALRAAFPQLRQPRRTLYEIVWEYRDGVKSEALLASIAMDSCVPGLSEFMQGVVLNENSLRN